MSKRKTPQRIQFGHDTTARIAIIVASFNDDITEEMLKKAQECASEYGATTDVVRVDGSFELPHMAGSLAETDNYDGIVAIGCLIKGGTIHFEVIANAAAQGLMDVSIRSAVPVGFGVITAQTHEQAVERIILGYDATHAVLQQVAAKQLLERDSALL